MRNRLRTTAVILLSVACSAGHSRPKSARESNANAFASRFISAKELAHTPGTLLEAIQQLRPSMLASRGTPVLASVDGAPLADPSVLRSIPASIVQEVRLLRASSSVGRPAVTTGGEVVVGDIIVVVARPGAISRSP